MKKNRMMRIASVLLVAVLLTTSIISGTFAKYVTSGETGDSARVAKFGVVVTGSGSLFDENYFRVKNGNGPAGDEEEGASGVKLTVESSAADNVVAPGTKNDEGVTFSLSGQPEVDVRITFDLEVIEDIFLVAGQYPDLTKGAYYDGEDESALLFSDSKFNNADDYYPLQFTLKGAVVKAYKAEIEAEVDGITVTGTSVTGTLAQIKEVLDVINANGGIYVDANTDLSTIMGGDAASNDITLTWAWDFDDEGAGTYDKQDTLLGDLAAENGNVKGLNPDGNAINKNKYNLNVDVALTVTVTQVD